MVNTFRFSRGSPLKILIMTTKSLRCHSIWEDGMLVELITASQLARYHTVTNSCRNIKWLLYPGRAGADASIKLLPLWKSNIDGNK